MVALFTLLVIGVGWAASQGIIVNKPVTYLRGQQNG
jgi:hypothetical protein